MDLIFKLKKKIKYPLLPRLEIVFTGFKNFRDYGEPIRKFSRFKPLFAGRSSITSAENKHWK